MFDFWNQTISLGRYFLVVKRKASKGCPKQKLKSISKPTGPFPVSLRCPSCTVTAEAIGSASVVLQPLRHCWSTGAGC